MMIPTNPFEPELWAIEQPQRIRRMMPARIGDYCDSNTFGNVAYIEDGEQINILPQYDASRIILQRYSERLIDIPTKWDSDSKAWVLDVDNDDIGLTPPPTTVERYIFGLWATYWTDNNLTRYKAIYKLLHSDYDPILNYDKTSDISTNYGKVNTRTGSVKSDANIFGLNSGASGADSEDRTTTYNQLADSASGTDTVSERTYGNIGTMTTQDMMRQELEIRRYNLNQTMVDEWITMHTHY